MQFAHTDEVEADREAERDARAIQVFGAAGLSADFPLASFYADSRTLRFADGPDEVHRNQIGRLELREH